MSFEFKPIASAIPLLATVVCGVMFCTSTSHGVLLRITAAVAANLVVRGATTWCTRASPSIRLVSMADTHGRTGIMQTHSHPHAEDIHFLPALRHSQRFAHYMNRCLLWIPITFESHHLAGGVDVGHVIR